MRNVTKCIVLGLLVIAASLVSAAPASAQGRWKNQDTSHAGGPFYMGISGCCVCHERAGCTVTDGTPIIVWQASQNDQLWYETAPGTGPVQNYYWDGFANTCLGVAGNSTSNGAQLQIQRCDTSQPGQTWELDKAESFMAPFPGCFVFRNGHSGQVAGVSAGNVQNGTNVIQWPFYLGTPNSTVGWHPDQFWCPS